MLDKRLLTNTQDDYLKELENIEQMKLRFGENSMNACEVMLRDIKESDRLQKMFNENDIGEP